MRLWPAPRATALALIRDADRLLLSEQPDPVKGVVGYRPLGGTIEFGERGDETVARELREELGVELVNIHYVGTLENIFEFSGRAGHEIALMYTADLRDPALQTRDVITAREDDGSTFRCFWKPLADFERGTPLYPNGLLDLIRGGGAP